MNIKKIKQETVAWLAKNRPLLKVEDAGKSGILINGKRLDHENISRMCARNPGRMQEFMGYYLEQLFPLKESGFLLDTWELAMPRIFPRIHPVSIFDHLNRQQVAHVPYIQNTVIVFVTDFPHITIGLTTEQMMQWGKKPEDLYKVAIENLERSTKKIKTQEIESKEGGKAILIEMLDAYDASRLLLPDLHDRLSKTLGPQFLVAIPARDLFVALTPNPAPFISRMRERVAFDHKRWPFPISADFFCVTKEGVSATAGQREILEAPLDPDNPLDKQILETTKQKEDASALLAKLYEQRRQQRSA